jgi:uncharacterized membrane protein YhaH (DUF805 family)
MNFAEAVGSALRQYAGFHGRARRSEYWWFTLFAGVLEFAAAIVDVVAHTPVIGLVVDLALLLPTLAVGVRRLHDTDRSGWWLLLGLIPLVGAIVLIVFFCQDSHFGPNRFGPSPKYPEGAPAGYGQPYPTA